MKCVLARFALLLCFALVSLSTSAAPAQTGRVHLHGTDYVPLLSWARSHRLEGRWLKRDEMLQFTNRSAKLLFTMDSREARINGVRVWLLFPLAQRDGELLISQIDLDSTLRPALSPP